MDRTARVLGGVTPSPTPPQEHGDQHDNDHNDDVEPLHRALKLVPVSAEEISHAGNDAHPDCRSEKIENRESLPWHAEYTRQRPGNNPHAKHEPRKENCRRPIASEELFSSLNRSE